MKSAHDGADPEVRRLIGLLADNGPDATAEELRASFRAFVQEVEAGGSERANVAVVYDTQVPGPDGPIKVRVFEPKATSKATDDCLVYFHGGGFVVGDIETSDLGARALAAGLDLRVVSVDYRLAPEHPFPAPFDDCLAVLRAVRVETTGAVYVGGESAGANLSAALALICRDTGLSLAGQILERSFLNCIGARPIRTILGFLRFMQSVTMDSRHVSW